MLIKFIQQQYNEDSEDSIVLLGLFFIYL